MRIVIIGSGAAGATAAQFARKTNRTAEIVLVSREPYGEYSRCGLPYVLSGVIDRFDSLIEYSPEWFRRFGVELRLSTEVTSIHPSRRTVTTASLLTSEEELMDYDSLVLATGARASIPPIPGASRPDGGLEDRVYTLRTMDDARAIAGALDRASSCMVIGAGLIGMELSEALCSRSGDSTLLSCMVDVQSHVLPAMIDADIADLVERVIAAQGIRFLPGTSVFKIESGDRCHVYCRSSYTGEEFSYSVDMVIVSTGTSPDTALGQSAGCAVGHSGGIVIDNRCRTSVEGVYAAGDCTEYDDFITRQPVPIGLGSIAVRHGRVAGINAAGGDECLAHGLLNSRTTRLFGLEVAATGPTCVELQKSGIEPIVGKVTGSTLPEYFPGGKSITAKLLAHPKDGRILGAQVVGEEGAHQRANLLAAAILNLTTAEQFLQLETCYAPPVAPTLDCVTLAAEAVRTKWKRTTRSEAQSDA